MKQTRLSPFPVREILARGDRVVPLGPHDYERQMRVEARLRKRRTLTTDGEDESDG